MKPALQLEIDSSEELESWLQGAGPVAVFQGLDLRPWESELLKAPLRGCVFIGCQMTPPLMQAIYAQGCTYLPRLDRGPYQPFRTRLYSVADLYGEELGPYAETPDAQIYQFSRGAGLFDEQLARTIHDRSIADALEEWLPQIKVRSVVAIMGGHAVPRGEPLFAEIARLARRLRREGFLPASGGGPGLMEATNLGAYLAPHPDEALECALERLSGCATFREGSDAWLKGAFEVRALFPPRAGGESLGIPTWFYGHEPPNVFASQVAKFFDNSLREETLLAVALGGILFAPGGAGTHQEIFQDACQNYYTTYGKRSPMIFYPKDFWTQDFPAFAVVQRLAQKGNFTELVHLLDDLNDVPALLLG
jgi:predicted Rossmann-fold nucleotide-binding protein